MTTTCLDCGDECQGSRCPPCAALARQAKAADYGPGYRARRAPLMGQPCALRLPGCTGTADTANHVVPRSRGGAGGPLEPACSHCNSALRDRRRLA